MAKQHPNREKSRGKKSPLDRRRLERFEDCALMPLELQRILDEELNRRVPCIENGVETTLPAQDLIARQLRNLAMQGHVWALEMTLRYRRLNIEQEAERARKERDKRAGERLAKGMAAWRRARGY